MSPQLRSPDLLAFDVSRLRLVTVPDTAPPYDDEVNAAVAGAVSSPARPDLLPTRADRLPARADRLPARADRLPARVVASPTGAAAPAGAAESPVGAGATAAWPRQFGQVIVEVLGGSRPARQLTGWTTDRVLARIGAFIPVFGTDTKPLLRRIVTSRPAAGVVEATVVASFGPRTRALALRFEHRPERAATPGRPARPARWLCTEIEAG